MWLFLKQSKTKGGKLKEIKIPAGYVVSKKPTHALAKENLFFRSGERVFTKGKIYEVISFSLEKRSASLKSNLNDPHGVNAQYYWFKAFIFLRKDS